MSKTPQSPYPTRLAAMQAGSRHYFTGIACRRGHLANRFTSSSGCSECVNWKVNAAHAQGFNVVPLHVTFPDHAPDAATLKRIQVWVGQAITDGSLLAELAERLPLQKTDKATHGPDYYRDFGWSDRQLVRAGYAVELPLVMTEKAQGTPLAAFLDLGWTRAALIEQGYAQVQA